MTNEELDALLAQATGRSEFCRDRGEVKTPDLIDNMVAAITTLRAQLADARSGNKALLDARDDMERCWREQKARADRAEAALAAQIEVDAGIADCYDLSVMSSTEADLRAQAIARHIRAKPHDRTALDRYREKVLRGNYKPETSPQMNPPTKETDG